MTTADEKFLNGLAGESAGAADAALKDDEVALLEKTSLDLAGLRPQVSDAASFDKLIAAVNESTRRNESIAQLKQRITDLGQGALAVAKEVAAIAAKV
jgi:hypothetical protein